MNEQLLTKVVVCNKLRLNSGDSISDEHTIHDLADGNSAVTNEIMGILIQELGLSDVESSNYTSKKFANMDTTKIKDVTE